MLTFLLRIDGCPADASAEGADWFYSSSGSQCGHCLPPRSARGLPGCARASASLTTLVSLDDGSPVLGTSARRDPPERLDPLKLPEVPACSKNQELLAYRYTSQQRSTVVPRLRDLQIASDRRYVICRRLQMRGRKAKKHNHASQDDSASAEHAVYARYLHLRAGFSEGQSSSRCPLGLANQLWNNANQLI